ncbi:hypothetical protein [Dyella caseinilytica]|uniref:Uncharacterized protein n=1 Tax=Dyella caseinilytica TaxID=1849581 RepID=A0ABX7GVX9_9GAMM|nr:hypothetical protein [Dyella caseinilytica]QRN53360.1 hypothetical protein ISN74_18365 [Dyella caseinilytica]GFZ85905.1 hypothetical protein GCM10011408_00240 [Dyella caseinilytica]
MHQSDQIKLLIERNSAEATRLHRRIHETFAVRDESPRKKEEWKQACQIFHSRYDELAFPGGYEGALDRLVGGDPETMEAAICFLEIRPYFFRSGYMFDAILRKAKHAPLSPEQKARLQVIVEEVRAWNALKRGEQNQGSDAVD